MDNTSITLELGKVEPESPDLWGWDNDTSVAMATGSPETRRLQFVTETDEVITLGLLSLTYDVQVVKTEAGVFSPVGALYPCADLMSVTLINPHLEPREGFRPKINFRKSRR